MKIINSKHYSQKWNELDFHSVRKIIWFPNKKKNINAIYFHEILWYKEIARHNWRITFASIIGHERDNVTHEVDTV